MKTSALLIMLSITATLSTSTGFAKSAKKATSATTVKMPVAGEIKWTGYGVGKEHHGTVQVKSGDVEMKGMDPVSGKIIFDMNTLTTADSEKLQGHLRSPDFFDVTKFPEATYEFKSVEAIKNPAAGQPTHKLTGNLTIKGKTEPMTVMALVKKEGATTVATGTSEIPDRTKFDIVYNSAKFKAVSALGDKLIKDNIKVELDIKTK